ncbi:T9SS type A sorting domain-containing protein [Chryseobacterium oryctis]|uniref:T9SS type A sorting domain-containing protein n=1 Tax=Chryseobacterium oryctis TaxID=2952618 RepID=A0ABT3HPL1_9FLAO|nr:T9SS type A sorting domain-containing protein [Chryseobacterium oryctis]MCW3161730.1 T9SS type A sorting domain-containing protein [Chryseobacterium oryctis]
MRRFYFSTILLGLSFTTILHAQTQISFENSEGYALSTINGQNGWQVWSANNNFPSTGVTVVNTLSSNGTNSVHMVSNGSAQNECGFRKDISSFVTGNDNEISFDHYIDALGGSGFGIVVFKSTNTTIDLANLTAYLSIDYQTGRVVILNPASSFVSTNTFISANQWHSFKIVIKKSTNILQYYVDGALVYSGTLGANKNIGVLDFIFNDKGSGFHVDNVKVTNLDNLSIHEISQKNQVSFYPNPAKSELSLKGINKAADYAIYSIDGKLVQKGNYQPEKRIDIQELIPGTYIFKINDENIKFLKE